MTKKKVKVGSNTIALNKRARHEYFIEDEIEAGIELQGWEVKPSLMVEWSHQINRLPRF